MHGGSRASEVVDLVDLQQYRLNDVVSNELKPRVPKQVHKVLLPPRKEIIHNNHLVPSPNKLVHQMAPNEPRPAGNHHPQSPPPDRRRHPPHSFPAVTDVAAGHNGISAGDEGLGLGGPNAGENGLDDEEG